MDKVITYTQNYRMQLVIQSLKDGLAKLLLELGNWCVITSHIYQSTNVINSESQSLQVMLSLDLGYWSIGHCTMGVVITWFNITWYPNAVIWAEYRSEIWFHKRLSMISYEVSSAMIWVNIDRVMTALHCICIDTVNFVYEQRRKDKCCL